MLQNEGADVTKAWNGQEAVRTIQKKQTWWIRCHSYGYHDAGHEWIRSQQRLIRSHGQRGCKDDSDHCNDRECIHGGQAEGKRSRNG